jgi:hypothetical protein
VRTELTRGRGVILSASEGFMLVGIQRSCLYPRTLRLRLSVTASLGQTLSPQSSVLMRSEVRDRGYVGSSQPPARQASSCAADVKSLAS